MRRTASAVLGLVAATSLLTACGSSDDTTTTSGARATPAEATTSALSDAAEVTVPRFPPGTGRQLARNRGAWDLVLRDVRVGEHDGFDRVVVEFQGAGTPGWDAQYVKTPTADGSGEVVEVDGDSFLGVSISGVTIRKSYPKTPEDFFSGPRHFAPERGGVIGDVHVGGVFEGYSQLFLGLDGDKAPFRVFALTDPARLVVDVKDD